MIEPNWFTATKRAELGWFVKKLKHASFSIHNVIFLDVLSLILRLSIAFQQEENDPVNAWDDGRFYDQDVKLRKYPDTKNAVSTFYGDCIMERRSENFLTSPVFSSLVSSLDTLLWPIDVETLATFVENQIVELIKHFNYILLSNSCDICQVQTEWYRYKNHIRYILENSFKTTYLNIWKKSLPIVLS